MIYVGLCGPKVIGVFDGIDEAVNRVAKLANVPPSLIEVKESFSGDLLCLKNDYPCARLVSTKLYSAGRGYSEI